MGGWPRFRRSLRSLLPVDPMNIRNYETALKYAAGESNAQLLLRNLNRDDRRGRVYGGRDADHTNRLVAADALEEEDRSPEAHILRTNTPIRIEDGKVTPDHWHHNEGYPVVYYPRDSGYLLCHDCANKHVIEWAKAEADGEDTGGFVHPDDIEQLPHWEGPPEVCEGCDQEIESAYGDPDVDE